MIIFTEHSEVVMSVGEMREIIRRSFLSGAASRNATTPATFIAETWLRVLERALREGKELTAAQSAADVVSYPPIHLLQLSGKYLCKGNVDEAYTMFNHEVTCPKCRRLLDGDEEAAIDIVRTATPLQPKLSDDFIEAVDNLKKAQLPDIKAWRAQYTNDPEKEV